MIRKLTLSLLFLLGLTTVSLGATITFDGPDVDPYIEHGFSIDVARIVNGNCFADPCMGLGAGEVSNLSKRDWFVTKFWFELLDENAVLTVTGLNFNRFGNLVSIGSFAFNAAVNGLNGRFVNTGGLFGAAVWFADILRFENTGTGNIRVDNIALAPIPPALPLFATGLVALGYFARRRRLKR